LPQKIKLLAKRNTICLESNVARGQRCFVKKLFSPLVLFCLAIFAAQAALINSQNYMPLSEWARGNGFYGYTRNHGDEIVLTNRAGRLVLDVNSAQAEINGVNVRLSFPVASVRGVPFIAQFDLDKTIRPLLFPLRCLDPKKITSICLDPGHGGRDTGYRVGSFFVHNEKTYTLALALELRDQLKKIGFKVILTRDQDTYPERAARPEFANRKGADLFVSLHFNSAQAGKNTVEGPETYCITPIGAASSNDSEGEGLGSGPCPANRVENESLQLAYQMQKSLVKNLGAADRGVRRARFEVLRTALMPAILIEGGYMSHPTEGKKIFDTAYRKQMAAAIVKGILAYQNLTAPPVPPPVKSSSTMKPAAASSRLKN
jgi:N-acetylmuramoyl-L-alanine amidase